MYIYINEYAMNSKLMHLEMSILGGGTKLALCLSITIVVH